MAKLKSTFNTADVEPLTSYDPIPAGKYLMVITDSEMKITRAGTGEYLQLVMQVIDGEHAGRRVWERLNLYNPNPTAVSMAEATLSGIARAVGVGSLDDSEALHDRPFIGEVKIVPANGQYDAKNEMCGYEPHAPAAPAAPAVPAAAAAPAGQRPWSRPAA